MLSNRLVCPCVVSKPPKAGFLASRPKCTLFISLDIKFFKQKISNMTIIDFQIKKHRHRSYSIIHKRILTHDVASGIDIMPCNKIDTPLVFYRANKVT